MRCDKIILISALNSSYVLKKNPKLVHPMRPVPKITFNRYNYKLTTFT